MSLTNIPKILETLEMARERNRSFCLEIRDKYDNSFMGTITLNPDRMSIAHDPYYTIEVKCDTFEVGMELNRGGYSLEYDSTEDEYRLYDESTDINYVFTFYNFDVYQKLDKI